jgi:aldehyde:ferredoxin oxidoreductase
MTTGGKRDLLMNHRKELLRQLIQAYYQERGWNTSGIPTIDTLKKIGLWTFLNENTKTNICELNG